MKIQSTNPFTASKELHKSIGWTEPHDFSIEEIANSLGIIVKEASIQGSEGRILIKGDSAIVTINSSITSTGKRNFVLAHEIGHFILHKNITRLFSDTHKTLSDWHKKGAHEQQANEFASELLMPSSLFKSKVIGRKLSVSLIEEVASFFETSLTASFLKYCTLGSFPIMVIFIESGIIKWKQCSSDFPFQYLPLNSNVPVLTVAGDFFNGKGLELKPELIDAIEWFPEDYQIKYKQDWKLWEQCYQVSENGLISCIWTY